MKNSREIKFRRWDKYNKVFIYSDETPVTFWAQVQGSKDAGEDAGIEQYTGLKDKNGKEIYEGDILGGHNPRYEKEGGKPSVVRWDNERACITIYRGDTSSGYSIESEIKWNEVIGNIYENPELI